jgi:hypothetical protein
MSRSSHCFDETHHKTNLPDWPAHTIAALPWSILIALRAMWDASREGLAAHRQYEHLRSRGVPHGAAIREALGIGVTPSQVTREVAKPLYFVGKA